MALDIQANTSYVELATDPRLILPQRFTVQGWFLPSEIGGASYRGYWSLGLTGANDRIFAAEEATTGKLFVAAFEGGLTKYRTGYPGGLVPVVGQWYNFATIVDMSGGTQDVWTAYFFVNGNYVGDMTYATDSGATGALAIPGTATFRVGQDHDGDSARSGAAHVRLFDRALTPAEIRASMFSRLCPAALRDDCLIDFPFNGDLQNRGAIGGAAVATGTTGFVGGPGFAESRPLVRLNTAVASGLTISPSGIALTATFGAPIVQQSPQLLDMSGNGIGLTTTFGSATVRPAIVPPGIGLTATFGTPVFTFNALPMLCATRVTGELSCSSEVSV